MAAVAESVSDDLDCEAPALRRAHGLDRSRLEQRLQAWGKWHEENRDFEGYASASVIEAWLNGGISGGSARSRINCLDMPPWITDTHLCVLALTAAQRYAVELFYIFTMKPSGLQWTLDEKLRIAGLSYKQFRELISSARARLIDIL